MKLIVGLGNPGKEYAKTRHNIGFMVLDELREISGGPSFKFEKRFKAEISVFTFQREKVILAKPQTFMNLSGEAVLKLAGFYKIKPADIWIIYDDLDLPLGTIRVRLKGSAGTHKGMCSVIEKVKTEDFPRFRLGIESRGEQKLKQPRAESFVLSNFKSSEIPLIRKTIKRCTELLKIALETGLEKVISRLGD